MIARTGLDARLRTRKTMKILNRITIKAKLALLLGLSAVSLVVALGIAATVLHQRMIDDRIAMMRAVVDSADGMASALEGEVQQGKLTRDEAIDRLRTALHAMKFDHGDGYLFVTRFDGVALIHGANHAQEGTQRLGVLDSHGTDLAAEQIRVAKSSGAGTIDVYFPKPGQTEPLQKILYVKAFAPWQAVMGTGAYVDDIEADFHSVLIRLGLVTLAIVATVALVAFLISRNITGALGTLRTRMEKLAAGNLAVDIPEAAQRDEVGAMGRTVQVFKDNALSMRQLQAEQEEIKNAAERNKKQVLATLADTFETKVRGIVDIVSGAATRMQATAHSMSQTAAGTRQQSVAATAGANQATANVQTVAAASEELSVSIGEIGRQVVRAAGVSQQAADEGERTNATVAGLAEAAEKIGEVVKLINDIASQTNLLALNATIEAARAGDAGKGFAVVASEVKSLANQTAKATDDIRAQIAAIQAETKAAVDDIQKISKTILEVNEISSSIASSVEEQKAATQEITRNVQQAASGTQDVSRNIEAVGNAVDKSGVAASEVLAAATELASQSQALRREVDQFLLTVRAA
jgi:methyl-accepting chemotaxis protein